MQSRRASPSPRPRADRGAGALTAEHPDCYVQTPLSENHAEIAFTAELYPHASDYLDVYESYGLVGPKSLLGHAIHLTEREISALAETGALPVFCPTSNLFLGSGLFDDARLWAHGIATDIGAGTSYSMLRTLNEGYKIFQLQGQKLTATRALYWITRGNAEVLGLEDRVGTLDAGTEADIVVLDAHQTPAMALRMERAESLEEELFMLQVMSGDRAIAETYVAGVLSKISGQKWSLRFFCQIFDVAGASGQAKNRFGAAWLQVSVDCLLSERQSALPKPSCEHRDHNPGQENRRRGHGRARRALRRRVLGRCRRRGGSCECARQVGEQPRDSVSWRFPRHHGDKPVER